MISKELLKVVLADKQVDKVDIRDNNVWFKKPECTMVHHWDEERINIYELTYKCKLWALEKGYIVAEKGFYLFVLTADGVDVVWQDYGEPFLPNRLFEACEWILNGLEK